MRDDSAHGASSWATETLPQHLVDLLQSTYQAYSEAARDRRTEDQLRSARLLAKLANTARDKAGWPLRLLAEPCGISAERLRQIMHEHRTSDDGLEVSPDVFPRYAPPPATRRRSKQSELTRAEAKELRELAAKARRNSGSRALDSAERIASERFSALIIQYHQRGVIWEDIATAAGLSVSGIRMRAARHGYGKVPPSLKPYRRIALHSPPNTVKGTGDFGDNGDANQSS